MAAHASQNTRRSTKGVADRPRPFANQSSAAATADATDGGDERVRGGFSRLTHARDVNTSPTVSPAAGGQVCERG